MDGRKDSQMTLTEDVPLRHGEVSPKTDKESHNRVHSIGYQDVEERLAVEEEDNGLHIHHLHDSSSSTSEEKSKAKEIIEWEHNDPENPYNWSQTKKAYILAVGVISALNSTFGSSLPSNAIPYIASYWNITNESQLILPISIYLVGYVCGPLLYGPLSESYGRQIIFVPTYCCFVIFTMACALSPNWAALNVFRLLCGVVASAPMTLVGGLYADVYATPKSRGRAMSIFMAATGIGPLISPIVSGFISGPLGWRWTFWIGLIVAGVSWFPIVFMPETYGPILLARRARKLRKSGANPNIYAAIELEKKGFKQMATVVLTRPVRMLFTELIVACACAYCALVYAIFYMFFEVYPIIFQGIYGMSTGVSGLMFLPIGVGEAAGIAIFFWYDAFLAKSRARGKAWALKEDSRRLPMCLIGGPLIVVGLFWTGWTGRADVPWVVPFLSGIPFGAGFLLVFIALLNFLADSYEIFAASAMAASSCTRSIFGATLPFAAKPMYDRLGVAWGSSLLGFISLAMCAIPILFLKYGDAIREGSKFCTALKELKAKDAEKARLREEQESSTPSIEGV